MWNAERRSSQQGYSLAELLVVVAIIGIMSLVTVPQFITYMRQNRMRTSARLFSADLRSARQRAISRTNPVAISFTPGAAPTAPDVRGRYAIFDRVVDTSTDPDTITWRRVGPWKQIDSAVYFTTASPFADDAAIDDSLKDIIFMPNGTISPLPASPRVDLKTDYDVPNNHCTYTFNISGSFTTALSTD